MILRQWLQEIVPMPAATIVSVSEYLATSYRPDCDYLDGKILERNVGEWDHSRLQMLLSRYLSNREKQWGIVVVPEQRVQVKPTRFRVPNIAVLAAPPADPIVVEPPLLCIEILSPSDRMAEMQERIDDYLNFGVRSVWLIHPHTRRAFVYTAESVQEVKDGILRVDGTEIYVPLHDLE
jgi:Uma2 family endonuclease